MLLIAWKNGCHWQFCTACRSIRGIYLEMPCDYLGESVEYAKVSRYYLVIVQVYSRLYMYLKAWLDNIFYIHVCLIHLLVQKHFDHAQFFWPCSIFFEHIQIFWTMVKSDILPFKLANFFECIQKYLNMVKKYLNVVKKYLN